MKIHLIKKRTIERFVLKNAGSRIPFQKWLATLKRADWNIPQDIVATFRSADILGERSKRVVFNIGGNHYRMICRYHFGGTRAHLFIKWIGTHAVYNQLCREGKQYTIDNC